jgi:hypothetical protein
MNDWKIINNLKMPYIQVVVEDGRCFIDIPIKNTSKYYRIYSSKFDTRVYLYDKESTLDDFDVKNYINASLMYWDSNKVKLGRVESLVKYFDKKNRMYSDCGCGCDCDCGSSKDYGLSSSFCTFL